MYQYYENLKHEKKNREHGVNYSADKYVTKTLHSNQPKQTLSRHVETKSDNLWRVANNIFSDSQNMRIGNFYFMYLYICKPFAGNLLQNRQKIFDASI